MAKELIVWRKHYFMLRNQPIPFRTICEVLRELWTAADERGDTIAKYKIEEAYDMAKRMQRKLTQYNKKEIYSSAKPEQPQRKNV